MFLFFSTSKKSLMIGLIKLAFVKALERYWEHVRRGMTIAYGSLPSKQVDVAHSIGWTKLTKRQNLLSTMDDPPIHWNSSFQTWNVHPNKQTWAGQKIHQTLSRTHQPLTYCMLPQISQKPVIGVGWLQP
jgi:hypothetical protein